MDVSLNRCEELLIVAVHHYQDHPVATNHADDQEVKAPTVRLIGSTADYVLWLERKQKLEVSVSMARIEHMKEVTAPLLIVYLHVRG
jgi:hypothetical protein